MSIYFTCSITACNLRTVSRNKELITKTHMNEARSGRGRSQEHEAEAQAKIAYFSANKQFRHTM